MADHDDVLTHPDFQQFVGWSWTLGMEHEPVEPSSVLLPARVDAPASSVEGSTAVGQFGSESMAAAAADALSGICVAETVILPGQPYPNGGAPDQDRLGVVIDQLRSAGASEAFITDADTGYMHSLDIRAHCDNRGQALGIGRQLAPIVWPPWVKGLIKPWAPGRKLSEEHVRARMYVASLRRSEQPPRDELELKIWRLWRAWQDNQLRAASQFVAGAAVDEPATAGQQYEAALHSLLGEEPEEWGMPWYLHWNVRVEDNDVCLAGVWCAHFATGFPALVRWLQGSGVRRAKYSLYNLMRP